MSLLANKTFQPSIIASSITLVAIIILCKLGFWQLDRAQQKIQQLKLFATNQTLSKESLAQTENYASFHGFKVQLEQAELTNQYWLLDNQVWNGQVGYGVLTQLKGEYFNNVIVHLGWIAADKYRHVLPKVALPQQITGSGLVKSQNFSQYSLSSTNEEATRVQTVAHLLNELNIDPSNAAVVYVNDTKDVDWPQSYQPVTMKPEKHQAYAVQWFSLAVAAFVIFAIASLKDKEVQ